MALLVEKLVKNGSVEGLKLVCAGPAPTIRYGVRSVLTGIALITDPLLFYVVSAASPHELGVHAPLNNLKDQSQ